MALHQLVATATTLIVRDDGDDDGGNNDSNCVTATPGPNGNVPVGACNSYYNYDPQYAPAVAVAVIFGLLTGIHLFESIAYRKRFAWVLIMGGLWETISFILHSLGAKDQQQISYATGGQILFLLAPLWVNAFVYMTFARMAHFYLPATERKIRGVKASAIAKLFVGFDIITFLVQAAGGSMLSPGSDANTIKIGLNVYLAGMGLQQFFIFVFLWLMIEFHLRCNSWGPKGAAEHGIDKRSWKPLLFALYGTLTFITIRNAYRIAEFAPGIEMSNPILYHEAYQYALDAFPMMLAFITLATFHPGRFLVGPDSEFPRKSRAQKKAEKAQKKAERQEKKARKGKLYSEEYIGQTEEGIALRDSPRNDSESTA